MRDSSAGTYFFNDKTVTRETVWLISLLEPYRFPSKMVKVHLRALDSFKASGPDFIPIVVMKNHEPEHFS